MKHPFQWNYLNAAASSWLLVCVCVCIIIMHKNMDIAIEFSLLTENTHEIQIYDNNHNIKLLLQ